MNSDLNLSQNRSIEADIGATAPAQSASGHVAPARSGVESVPARPPSTDAILVANESEEQKAHIARLLHDDLAQRLTVANMELTLLQQDLAAGEVLAPAALQSKLTELSELVTSASLSTRRIGSILRPRTLDAFGIAAALQSLVSKVQERVGGECSFEPDVATIDMDPGRAIHLWRIVDSFLSSVGGPVRVQLQRAGDALELHFAGQALPGLSPEAMARLRIFGGSFRPTKGEVVLLFPLA